jgi:hypothetical protein
MKISVVPGAPLLLAGVIDADERRLAAERLFQAATRMGNFSPGRLPHMNSEKIDRSTAHSHDLSRVTNKFCQNTRERHFGDIQIHTLTTTCAGHEHMARALPMIQA